MKSSKSLATLPEEILLWEILPKLPLKSLVRFKSVSKEWRDFITNDSALKKAHSRNRRSRNSGEISALVIGNDCDKSRGQDPKALFLSGGRDLSSPEAMKFDVSYLLNRFDFPMIFHQIRSSEGLVLLTAARSEIVLWNPATREARVLQEPESNFGEVKFLFDVAFDEESEDHKVLRVSDLMRFQIYSKRSDSWRSPRALTLRGFRLWIQRGVSIDGAFFFLAEKNKELSIFSFDYQIEEARRVIESPVPSPMDVEFVKWKDDSLGLITQSSNGRSYDFWTMRNEEDQKLGFQWSKLFKFDHDCNVSVCGAWSERFLIVQKPSGDGWKKVFALWDPLIGGRESDSCLELADDDFRNFTSVAVDYVPTLVSVYPDH